MIQRSRFCSMPERTAKSQEQMSKSCWVSAQPVLHDASGTWLRVNSSGRSEKQEISDTPYMTHSIIESTRPLSASSPADPRSCSSEAHPTLAAHTPPSAQTPDPALASGSASRYSPHHRARRGSAPSGRISARMSASSSFGAPRRSDCRIPVRFPIKLSITP